MNNLDIILPVYNERISLPRVLKEWHAEMEKHNLKYRFIICEDGSTDGTKQLLQQLRHHYPLAINQAAQRRGYGRAVMAGIKAAQAEYLLCVDSDGQCDPADFAQFWQKKEKADVLIGWRKKRADPGQRKLLSSLFKSLFSLLFPTSIHDPSAPFVLCKRRTIISQIKYLDYLTEGFWWGFVGMCVKQKLSLYEIPINHRKRISGKTSVYKISAMPGIAVRNLIGLLKLKISS